MATAAANTWSSHSSRHGTAARRRDSACVGLIKRWRHRVRGGLQHEHVASSGLPACRRMGSGHHANIPNVDAFKDEVFSPKGQWLACGPRKYARALFPGIWRRRKRAGPGPERMTKCTGRNVWFFRDRLAEGQSERETSFSDVRREVELDAERASYSAVWETGRWWCRGRLSGAAERVLKVWARAQWTEARRWRSVSSTRTAAASGQ